MIIQENIPLGTKTTMHIGGNAKYYAEIHSEKDYKEALEFAKKNHLITVILGGGSNTIFADGEIKALVVRIKAENVNVDVENGRVSVEAGKNLAMLVNELALKGLDLSPLTGIPGSVGGAVIGNAGQGPEGTWINSFIENVYVITENGKEVFDRGKCLFGYRESYFKHTNIPYLIWEVELKIPKSKPEAIHKRIESLLETRLRTQPHTGTAGSCFKAHKGTPAWKLIDECGLRGRTEGGICISEKHANFLINKNKGTYADAVALVEIVQKSVKENLDVEMRFIRNDGSVEFP